MLINLLIGFFDNLLYLLVSFVWYRDNLNKLCIILGVFFKFFIVLNKGIMWMLFVLVVGL